MVVAPAVCVGAFVVFGMGYVLTEIVAGKIGTMLEERKRKTSGLIPPLKQTTSDLNPISVVGGVFAVLLVLMVLFTASSETQISIWYGLTGLGIIVGVLSFLLRSGSGATRTSNSTEYWKASATPTNRPKQQTSKDVLYQRLLAKTRNNRELADRLIEYERKKKPQASEEELIKNAIDRWERDNR